MSLTVTTTNPRSLTVRDLIAALSKLPEEMPVALTEEGGGGWPDTEVSAAVAQWHYEHQADDIDSVNEIVTERPHLIVFNSRVGLKIAPDRHLAADHDYFVNVQPLDFGETDSEKTDPHYGHAICDIATDGTVDIPAYVKLVNQHFGLQNIKPTSNTLPIVEKYIAECEENNGAGDYDGEIRLLEKLRDEIAAIQ